MKSLLYVLTVDRVNCSGLGIVGWFNWVVSVYGLGSSSWVCDGEFVGLGSGLSVDSGLVKEDLGCFTVWLFGCVGCLGSLVYSYEIGGVGFVGGFVIWMLFSWSGQSMKVASDLHCGQVVKVKVVSEFASLVRCWPGWFLLVGYWSEQSARVIGGFARQFAGSR
ncbi:unnamed protein product [Ilex paraguariensis]|uniref:Transmembrane protein n=1 Tax=Ilex paraguariensis TaxID=185542 RepID=A0ABC8QYC6_9AQUA